MKTILFILSIFVASTFAEYGEDGYTWDPPSDPVPDDTRDITLHEDDCEESTTTTSETPEETTRDIIIPDPDPSYCDGGCNCCNCCYEEPEPEPRFILVPEVICENITTSSLIESTSMTTFTSFSTIIQTITSESPVVFSVPTHFCEEVCETTMVSVTATEEPTSSSTSSLETSLPTDVEIPIDDGDRSLPQTPEYSSVEGKATRLTTTKFAVLISIIAMFVV